MLAYGTNEAGSHNWTYESYRDLLGRIVDMLHATLPTVSVLVIGPPDRSVRAGRRVRNWTTYTQTMRITDAQRDACQAHGCAFWSWRDRMGGLGSMNRWVANGLAQPDHHANLKLLQRVAKTLKLGEDRLFTNIQRYGNTSSASMLIAAAEWHAGSPEMMKPFVLAGFGSGLTWGAMLATPLIF